MKEENTEHNKPNTHGYFMEEALLQARKAFEEMETPVGAVIVKDGRIIARGHNQREGKQDTTLHAEMTAIRKACAYLKSWRLDDCDLYVNIEPCIMCAGAIQQARIRKVYFGALQPKTGGVVSTANIFDLESNHKVEYEGDIMAEESLELMSSFFKILREENNSLGLTKGERRKLNKLTP